jgi:hypothetical protein
VGSIVPGDVVAFAKQSPVDHSIRVLIASDKYEIDLQRTLRAVGIASFISASDLYDAYDRMTLLHYSLLIVRMDVDETWYGTRSYGTELINKVRADGCLK